MASRKTAPVRKSKGERYVAFLRAINVGGHIVKMDQLRKLFEGMRFANVETFIASGNVIFESNADPEKLERQIEAHLQKNLGYGVSTFLRTTTELQAVAAATPFPPKRRTDESTLYIGFLGSAPASALCERVAGLSNPIDDLAVVGREVHWLCQGKMLDSRINYALLEKTLATPATFRNVNTVNRLVAKLTASED
jgi:uncharacterized protein (DUF1697 family)